MKTYRALLFVFCLVPSSLFALEDTYAAIAYSPSTGLWGTSYRQPTQQAAYSQAVANCYAPDCQVQVWGRDTCIALAVGRDNMSQPPIYGWAYDRSVIDAQRMAMERCFDTFRACQMVASVCSGF